MVWNLIFSFFVPVFAFSQSSPTPSGSLTISGMAPYQVRNGALFVAAAAPKGWMNGFIDADSGFKLYDVELTQDTDTQRNHMVVFEVYSNKTFGKEKGKQVLLTVSATASGGTDKKEVPIAAAQESDGIPKLCVDQDNCQANITGGRTYAARYTPGTKIKIGLYPRDICQAGVDRISNSGAQGCNGKDVFGGIATATTIPLTFKVYVGDNTSGLEAKEGGESDTLSMNLTLQRGSPTYTCTNQEDAYFPGDTYILVKTDSFPGFSTPNGAPVTTVVVAANPGESVVTDGARFRENAITGFVDYDQSSKALLGFTNTTNGTDHRYATAFSVRDAAGVIAKFDTDCVIRGVQTSGIETLANQNNCFIANGAFQSRRVPPVILLRQFRDQVLLPSFLGEKIVQAYYRFSPKFAEVIWDNPPLQKLALLLLIPFQLLAWVSLNFGSIVLVWIGMFVGGALFVFKSKRIAIGILVLTSLSGLSYGAETAAKPTYIDRLREGLPEKESSEGYTQKLKEKLPAQTDPDGNYIERLKEGLPEDQLESEKKTSGTGSYTADLKQKLESEEKTDDRSDSAIERLKTGKSELKMNRGGKIHHAMGFRLGLPGNRNVAGASGKSMSSIYRTDGWLEDFSFFYEFQPFHSEWFGNIGIYSMLGISHFYGNPEMKFDLKNPKSGKTFGKKTKMQLQFWNLPIGVGLSYRFNLLRIIRPYVFGAPAVIPFYELRNDPIGDRRGFSASLVAGGGAMLLLDWLSRETAWNLYAEQGVKKFYLYGEFSKMIPVYGDVRFAVAVMAAGFAAEF